MNVFVKLRKWINRDDGRYYRAGNRHVGVVETVGLLLFVGALFLWQLHAKVGISSVWSYASGAAGLLLVFVGNLGGNGSSGA
jgi:hypothetical protein